MTPATPAIQQALDALHDLEGHLARYDSPHKLVTHLEASHKTTPTAAQLAAVGNLRRLHGRKHADGLAAAKAALHDAQDQAADRQALGGCA